MHVLNSIEVLHENPYTGDKITKAKIVSIDKSILPPVEKSASIEQLPNQDKKEHSTEDNGEGKDKDETKADEAVLSPSYPKLVVIKYLSDYRTTRRTRSRQQRSPSSSPRAPGQGWSSDSSYCSSESENEDIASRVEKEKDDNHGPILDRSGRQLLPPLGQKTVPVGIRFGVKAMREIKALKAAQGHPSIIPFLGFTEDPIKNPLQSSQEQRRRPGSSLPEPGDLFAQSLSVPAPPSAPASASHQSEESVPLGGPLLGRSLFQDDAPPSLTSSTGFALTAAPSALEAPQDGSSSPGVIIHRTFKSSRFSSDSDSDDNLGSDEDADEDENESDDAERNEGGSNIPMKRKKISTPNWNRVFSRQPRAGGILLPYLPLTMQDLIRIGWTKTRPLLVETCMRQILEGLLWIHDEVGLIHRDISPGNIMVALSSGGGLVADGEGRIQCMISDFGCATFHPTTSGSESEQVALLTEHDEQPSTDKSHLEGLQSYEKPPGLTFEVGTRAYRAPELLFSSGNYDSSVDLWSAGVIFAEMYLGRALFQSESDIGQVCAIVKVLGTPTEENWPEYTSMPDYGKLVFKAIDTSPLYERLLGTDTSEISTKENIASESDQQQQHPLPPPPSPPTLISTTAFDLIERLIMYSGSARLSANEALAFQDRYLDSQTLVSSENSADEPNLTVLQLEEQCTLNSRDVLLAKEQLRLQEQDGDEDECGYDYGFSDGYSPGGDDEEDDVDNLDEGHDRYGYRHGSRFADTGSTAENAGDQDYGLHPGLSFERSAWPQG